MRQPSYKIRDVGDLVKVSYIHRAATRQCNNKTHLKTHVPMEERLDSQPLGRIALILGPPTKTTVRLEYYIRST